jgi:hypothetical protein
MCVVRSRAAFLRYFSILVHAAPQQLRITLARLPRRRRAGISHTATPRMRSPALPLPLTPRRR